MAELSFRCPRTGLLTLGRGRLHDLKSGKSFAAIKVKVAYCMGCSEAHVVTVADTLSLDFTSAEIKQVADGCVEGAGTVGEHLQPGRRRRERKDGFSVVSPTVRSA